MSGKVRCEEIGKAWIRLLANCPKIETIKWRVRLPADGVNRACSGVVYLHISDQIGEAETVYFIRHCRLGERLRVNRNAERAAIRAEINRQCGASAVAMNFTGL